MSLTKEGWKEAGLKITPQETAIKLLREAEPLLSGNIGSQAVNAVFISEAQQLRNSADRLEYTDDLKRRIREFLANL